MIHRKVRCRKCDQIWNIHTKGAKPYCLDCGNKSDWEDLDVNAPLDMTRAGSLVEKYELTIELYNQRADLSLPKGMLKFLMQHELLDNIKYEYNVQYTRRYLTPIELREYGDDGWELVSETFIHGEGNIRTVLKRAMLDENNRERKRGG